MSLEKLSSPKGFQRDMSGGWLTIILQLCEAGAVIPSEASRGFLLALAKVESTGEGTPICTGPVTVIAVGVVAL